MKSGLGAGNRPGLHDGWSLQERLLLFMAVGCLIGLLQWTHASVDSRAFAYLGIVYRPEGVVTETMKLVIAIAPVLWLPVRAQRPSDVAVWLFYLFPFLSFVLFSTHNLALSPTQYLFYWFLFIGGLIVVQALATISVLKLPWLVLDRRIITTLIVWITLVGAIWIAVLTDFRLDLSFADVYVRRFSVRSEIASGTLESYALATVSLSLVPICFAVGMVRRNAVLIFVGALAAVLIFSFDGKKIVLLTPLLLAGIYAGMRLYRVRFVLATVVAFNALTLLALVGSRVIGPEWTSALWSYRLFSGPGLTTSRYLEFFQENPYYFLSGGLLSGFMDSRYPAGMSILLGSVYAPGTGLNMNTNFWTAAFGEAGPLGLLFASVVVGLLLALINAFARRGEAGLNFLMAGFIGFLLTESALQTAILSGGLLLTFTLLYILAGSARAVSRS